MRTEETGEIKGFEKSWDTDERLYEIVFILRR